MRALRRTSGITEEDKIERGILTRTTNDQVLEKKIKKLEQIEKKTDDLLKKAKTRENRQLTTDSTQTVHRLAIDSPQSSHKTKREASYFSYICMPPRKLPRKILDHVKENSFIEAGQWYSRIDSYELSTKVAIGSHQISNTVRQLRDEGFFEIIESSTAGYRLLKINPEIFGLKFNH